MTLLRLAKKDIAFHRSLRAEFLQVARPDVRQASLGLADGDQDVMKESEVRIVGDSAQK